MEIKEFIEKMADAIELENYDEITPETEFRDLEDWSSLSVMLLIAFYDDEFDKQIGDREIQACTTIEDLYSLTK